MPEESLLSRLSAPFPAATVSWRLGPTNAEKTRGMALAYIDARDVQDRLNEVCGVKWQTRHPWSSGTLIACEIGIYVDGEWIWRGDGAGEIENEAGGSGERKEQAQDMARKAAFSDSFKRAAVRWGIGRYLYDIDSPWVEIEARGRSYIIPDKELARLRALLMRPARAAGDNGSGAHARNAPAAAAGIPSAAAPKAKHPHPKWDYAGARFREIERALKGATTETTVNDIVELNEADVNLIHELHPPSYQKLMTLRDQMLEKLQQPSVDVLNALRTGSSPTLMGEP